MSSKILQHILPQTEVLALLSRAHNHEYSRQVIEGIDCLKPFWIHYSVKPDIEAYSLPIQGEILLRCGSLLSYLCQLEQYKLLDLARDWFTESADIFERIGESTDRVAEVQTELAMTYWREDRYEEALLWLETASAKNTNELSSASLRNISYIILVLTCMSTPESFQRAAQMIKDKDIYVRLCADNRVKAHYYNNSALLMTRIANMAEALERHYHCIHYCNLVGNRIGAAIAENNIGWVYLQKQVYELDKALIHVNRGLEIFNEFNDFVRLAGCWDTKAQIHIELGELDTAADCIEKSLEILIRGEDYGKYVTSLNTKVQLLLRREQTAEALMVYSLLYQTAKIRISEAAAEGYARDFSNSIYLIPGSSFFRQTELFEKRLLESALITAKGSIEKTAEILELPEELLIEMLETEHHDLIQKYELKNLAARKIKKIFARKKRKTAAQQAEQSNRKPSGVSMVEYECNGFPVRIPESIQITQFMPYSKPLLASVGLTEGRIAVVSRALTVPDKYPTVVRSHLNSTVHYGFRIDAVGMIGLEVDNLDPVVFVLDDVEIVGKIIGYCEFDFDKKIYKYHPLDI